MNEIETKKSETGITILRIITSRVSHKRCKFIYRPITSCIMNGVKKIRTKELKRTKHIKILTQIIINLLKNESLFFSIFNFFSLTLIKKLKFLLKIIATIISSITMTIIDPNSIYINVLLSGLSYS